ncbi:SIMPL domain-containing protein [Cohaesibacter intestini]|uniref:SIMPL domain-containing protein n=1 Tax=Cohaesibacter intestini TaxID=2211145 RepID=UPI000DE9A3E6|nr:SIMPL domain-containing protein [Cohaesibacter intestini]
MKKQFLALATVLPLLALPAHADEAKGGTISVTGTGIIDMAPDMALVSAGVQSRAKQAQQALAENNTKMQALFAELEKAGIDKKDIQTDNFNIHPEIVYPQNNNSNIQRAPEIVGYVVNNQVGVKIRKLENVGSVLTALVNAGANNMSGLRFDVSDKANLMDEARKAAIANARAKAELYATELGTSIKRLTSLSENGGNRPPVPMMMRAGKAEMMVADVPVAEGTLSMSITINTNWELAQ